jgi:glycolate oxidase iron-sulfur subunit
VSAPTTTDGTWLEDLLTCVHCGFCLPVCPTYEVLCEENDSPRGRIYLMRALAEGRSEAGEAFDLHIGRCLGCRACETACPAGVEYGALLERARERSAGDGPRDRLLDLALRALTAPGLSRLTWSLGRLARGTGLAWLAARIAPRRLGLGAGMLHATRPAIGTGASRPVRSGFESGSASGSRPESGPGSGSYALLEGCVMAGLFPHVHAATRRTLARRGLAEAKAPGQACCGALHAHAGRLDGARDLARANIESFERADAPWIVTDSAGCGAALRDYPAWFRDEPEWRRRAEALAGRVRDVTELLVTTEAEEKIEAGSDRLPRRIAYDAPCHLLHAQGVRDAPLQALTAAGFEAIPLPSWERCCGGAGLYNLMQPELSDAVLERKLAEIREGGFQLVATGNPGCIMFLRAGLARAGLEVGVVHPVELVDRAEGNAGRGTLVSRS